MKELPKGVIIGLIVLIILGVVGIAWKSLSDSNPTGEKLPASMIKPDPLPPGVDQTRKQPAQTQGNGP